MIIFAIMTEQNKPGKKISPALRAVLEVGFIIFLFYSNLLMGEFNQSGQGRVHGLCWALNDIFTLINFSMALGLGLIGYLVVEFLRRRL